MMTTDRSTNDPGSLTPGLTAPGSTDSSHDLELRSAKDVLFRKMLKTMQPMAPDLPHESSQRPGDAP